jgi:hypothetical protein
MLRINRRFNDRPGFPIWFIIAWLAIFIVNISLLGFGVWVVIKLLAHFGVI